MHVGAYLAFALQALLECQHVCTGSTTALYDSVTVEVKPKSEMQGSDITV